MSGLDSGPILLLGKFNSPNIELKKETLLNKKNIITENIKQNKASYLFNFLRFFICIS